jgi:hypothetical protein
MEWLMQRRSVFAMAFLCALLAQRAAAFSDDTGVRRRVPRS